MGTTDMLDLLQELQALDRGVQVCEEELAALPRNLAAAEEEAAGVQAQVDEAQARVDAILKRRRDLEQEIEAVDQQIVKYETQKISVKTNEEFHAINHQIAHQKTLRSGKEDEVLLSYDDEETAREKVKQVSAKLEEVRKTVAARRKELEDRATVDKERIRAFKERREAVIPGIDPKILVRYESIRARKGSAVVAVSESVCQGCFSTLPPQVQNDVRKRDSLQTCEFCGRFLINDPKESPAG